MKQAVICEKAPSAIGPYSQAVMLNDSIYVSGQLPINFESGRLECKDISGQTRQALNNIKNILNEAGYSMDDIVKTTVYLDNMEDFDSMNKVYSEFFSSPYPARAAFEVSKLPKNALVEIEAVALK